jgi:hypothetical protein
VLTTSPCKNKFVENLLRKTKSQKRPGLIYRAVAPLMLMMMTTYCYNRWYILLPLYLKVLSPYVSSWHDAMRTSPMNSRGMTWLRRLVAGLSRRRPGFATRTVHVEFAVDRLALGQVFLAVLRLSPVSIIPQ